MANTRGCIQHKRNGMIGNVIMSVTGFTIRKTRQNHVCEILSKCKILRKCLISHSDKSVNGKIAESLLKTGTAGSIFCS